MAEADDFIINYKKIRFEDASGLYESIKTDFDELKRNYSGIRRLRKWHLSLEDQQKITDWLSLLLPFQSGEYHIQDMKDSGFKEAALNYKITELYEDIISFWLKYPCPDSRLFKKTSQELTDLEMAAFKRTIGL